MGCGVGRGDDGFDFRVGGGFEPFVGVVVGVCRQGGGLGFVAEYPIVVLVGEGFGELFQGVPELAGDHPHGGGLAFGKLGEFFQVLVGKQFGGDFGVADGGVDFLDRPGLALGLEVFGGAFTLRPEDSCLPLGLGTEDGRVFFTLGGEDAGLFLALGGANVGFALAFGGENHGAFFTLRLHLHFHGLLD